MLVTLSLLILGPIFAPISALVSCVSLAVSFIRLDRLFPNFLLFRH